MSSLSSLLTVDIGNTAMKLSVYNGESLTDIIAGRDLRTEQILDFIGSHPEIEGVIYCLVGVDYLGLIDMLRRETKVPLICLDSHTAVPIDVDYDRMKLGDDRLAAAVGVASEDRTVLLVDAGTAVTLDLTRGLRYAGGNISPGVNLRFEALNRFTQRLPRVENEGTAPLLGHSTKEAIRSGVERGLAYEVQGTFRQACDMYGDVKLVLTGGNARLLSRYLTILNVPHSIDREAVGRGLVRIYNYNNK